MDTRGAYDDVEALFTSREGEVWVLSRMPEGTLTTRWWAYLRRADGRNLIATTPATPAILKILETPDRPQSIDTLSWYKGEKLYRVTREDVVALELLLVMWGADTHDVEPDWQLIDNFMSDRTPDLIIQSTIF